MSSIEENGPMLILYITLTISLSLSSITKLGKMSLGDVTSARSSPAPEACPECDTSASVTSDLHKLVLTGVCIMSLARRRNRYSYM
ncbi:hypothetical protein HF086_015779, partial [Spodoptera exigua]